MDDLHATVGCHSCVRQLKCSSADFNESVVTFCQAIKYTSRLGSRFVFVFVTARTKDKNDLLECEVHV